MEVAVSTGNTTLACAVGTLLVAVSWVQGATQINYADHVRPLFVQNCASCHNADKQSGGLNVASFEDFLAQAAGDGDRALDFSTMFVPIFRVERIFLDQQVGEVESYTQRFERRVGLPIEAYVRDELLVDDSGNDLPH